MSCFPVEGPWSHPAQFGSEEPVTCLWVQPSSGQKFNNFQMCVCTYVGCTFNSLAYVHLLVVTQTIPLLPVLVSKTSCQLSWPPHESLWAHCSVVCSVHVWTILTAALFPAISFFIYCIKLMQQGMAGVPNSELDVCFPVYCKEETW